MSSDFRLQIIGLFLCERHGQNPDLWPKTDLSPPGSFREWYASRRSFSREEVLAGRWLKLADHGNARLVTMHPDGTLTEADVFAPASTRGGFWELADKALRLRVGDYTLDVIAGDDLSIHSGIEANLDSPKGERATTYFKVIHFP